MPRRKSEKSQLPQIHHPPAKNICLRKGPHPITRQEEISSDSEEHDLSSDVVESNAGLRVTLLSKNSSSPVDQPTSCFPSKIVCEESDAKPNRSLEALFQAADSELQNYEISATRATVSPRVVVGSASGSGVVQFPASVQLIANSLGMPKFTATSDPADSKALPVPLLRLNFSTDSKPRTLELQTGADLGSQGVIQVENENSLRTQGSTGLDQSASTELPGDNSSPGQHKLKHSLKLGKCGVMYKPGKYVCKFCNRICAKPSVLQKHLRTHTGERPYPCNDCGFCFKTKSNLYKHCKSRVHLTKMEPCQDMVLLQASEGCSSKAVSLETDMAKGIFGKAGMESEPTKVEKLQLLPQQTTQKPNLSLKFLSCDAEIGRAGSIESDLQPNLAARSLSVPESNEDRLSVALHSLLRLSDGSIYLMEKLVNGHAILRPVLQEVGLASANQAIGLACANQAIGLASTSQAIGLASPIQAIGLASASQAIGLASPNQAIGLASPNQAIGLASLNQAIGLASPNQANGLASPNQAISLASPNLAIGLAAPNQAIGLAAPSQPAGVVIPRQAVAGTSSNLPVVMTGPQSTKTNGWVVSANAATAPFSSVTGAKQTGAEQKIHVPESQQIQREIHSSLSLPDRSVALHSSYPKILQKSLSANVSMTALTSHRSHSLTSAHAISIAPKMAPIDPKNATPEAVQQRIAMLISQNASIIDMPMADAPRPKRVLRHNSEAATNTEANATNPVKPLQRAKSLVPYTSVSPNVTRINAELTTPISSTMSVATKKKKPESLNAVDMPSKTTSNFLLVPNDPNLKGCSLPIKPGFRSQTSNLELSNPLLFPKPAMPIKAKSLDMTAKPETLVRSIFPQKEFLMSSALGLPVGKRLNEATIHNVRLLNEAENGSSLKHVPGTSQGIHVVLHLPNSTAPEMVNTSSRELDTMATNATLCDVRTIAKDVSEKRQEFARAHLMIENGSKTQFTNQMTNSAEMMAENSSNIGSAVPLQYLVIPAAPNPTQTFVPVVPSTLPMLIPQVAKSFDSTSQNSSVAMDVSESSASLKRGRPKGAKNKQKASSVSSPPTATTSPGSTFRSIPSICVTPAEAIPVTESSLWKLKLKGRLLMKRSLSIERTLSEERESVSNKSLDTAKGSSVIADTRLPSDSLVYQETNGLQRSCSYDAAMPLKKRRKTLTELGRGTAFGTRVEDGSETTNAASAAQSRTSPLLVEAGKRSPSPAGNRRTTATANSNDIPVTKTIGSHEQQEMEIIQECVAMNCLSMLKNTPTNQGSERHCISSSICSVRGCQKLPDVVRIPRSVAQQVPGLLPDRTDVHLVHPVDNSTVNEHLEILETLDIYKIPESKNDRLVAAKHRPSLRRSAALGFLENSMAVSGCPGGSQSECRSTEQGNESVMVKTGVASALLLLSHLYPSLNPSTNTTFCSVTKPQPMYLSQDANKKLSMYSTWQVAPAISSCSAVPEVSISSTFEQRHMSITVSPHLYATSNISGAGVLTHSSYWNFKKVLEKKSKSQEGTSQVDVTYELPDEVEVQKSSAEEVTELPSEKNMPTDETFPPDAAVKTYPSTVSVAPVVPKKAADVVVTKETKRVQIFPGGYKSNEDYVYIRGRGKGKYVCEACGIRCKKPSMLKKHLRTHTDIRPHHCDVCSFGFKTKGNLSKHIKSKAHHLRCSDLGIAPVQRFSDDASFDSQVPMSSGGENNESLDMNIASSSGDPHDDEDLDDVENDCSKEDNEDEEEEEEDDDDDDDEDDDDDGDNLDGDGDDSLVSSDVPESFMMHEQNTIPESTRSSYSFEGCSLGGQADVVYVRAATDSEAAASLLDLSKGDPTAATMSNMPESPLSSPDSHPLAKSQGPALFSGGFLQPSSGANSQTQDQENNSCQEKRSSSQELQNEVIPRKTAGFIPPVLLITSCPSSSFQLPSPVFVACISSTAMTASTPKSDGGHPWVVLPSSVLVQKNSDAGRPPPFHDTHCQDELPVISGASPINVLTTPSCLPPVSSPVSPSFPSGDSAPVATAGKTRAACEILPVPGKVSGNVAECVDGKYVKYVCPVCTKSFSKAHQLVLHKNIHYMERPFRCLECGVSFQNRTLLERHQRSEKHACKTDDPRPFKCDNCGVAFRIHGHLAKHLRSKVHIAKCEGHGKVPSEERDCDGVESESTPPQSADVLSGMESIVTFENCGSSDDPAIEAGLSADLACVSQRAAQSKDPTVLMTGANAMSSTVSVPIEANVLAALRKNASFSEADCPNVEASSSQPESHRCDICSKVFNNVAMFEKHISSHVELRPYICEFCDAGFTNARLLDSHLNTHYQSKEHVCGVCGDMLTGKLSSHQQSEVHASPSRHCGQQPVSESTVMLSRVTEAMHRSVTPSDLNAVRILPEISASNRLRVDEGKVSTGAILPAESSCAGGSLLKVVPSQNILALANPNVLLMKSFNVGTLPESSSSNIALGLGSVNFPSGSLVRSTETLKSSTVSQPLGILLATPRSSFENSGVLSTAGFVPFHDGRQMSIRPDSAGEPVCRFLTVSFQIGENVFSESTVRTDHEKSAFIASNFSGIVQNSAQVITTSASNVV